MKILTYNDLNFANKKFWTGFITTSFPTALDEESDLTLTEIIDENDLADYEWWADFTEYYEGILDETDGYSDDPKIFLYNLTPSNQLKVEFHPSETVYFINDKEIACTGAHYHIHVFSFAELLEYAKNKSDYQIFLLLLPLTYIKQEDSENAVKIIKDILSEFFLPSFIEQIANSIAYGLTED